MKLLIRYTKKQGQGEVSEEKELNTSILNVGRGTNQDILLSDPRVALHHAKISLKENSCKVAAASGKYVLKNSQVVNKCTLKIGEEIDISGHKISLFAGELGYDFVLVVSISSVEHVPLQKRYRLNISDLKLSKRIWSWVFSLFILILFLLLPVLGVFNSSWMDTLRESPLPDDTQWLAGDLIKPHKFIGDDCAQCHTTAFIPTNNEACLSCHTEVKRHVNDTTLPAAADEVMECTSCHKEHNPQETLNNFSQQICVDCHLNPILDSSDNVKFDKAIDFEKSHPAFSVSVLTAQIQDNKIMAWQPERQALTSHQLIETSNLKFPHQVHLDTKGIKSPTGDIQMVCSDCHVPGVDGGEMQPITMENNCQSCHQLTFDIDDPTRVVPHGSPDDVMMMMREYYAFRYIYQNFNNESGKGAIVQAGDLFAVRQARRPGRDKKLRKDFQHSLNERTVASIEELTKDTIRSDALVWAESRAYVAATDIFERQACDVCHVVTKNDNAVLPWEVKPVRLTKQWLPHANFTHDPHQTQECETCHQATTSELSSDILMPDIDNCQQCHGSEDSENLIPNTCIDCHGYHEAKTHLLDLKKINYKDINLFNLSDKKTGNDYKIKVDTHGK